MTNTTYRAVCLNRISMIWMIEGGSLAMPKMDGREISPGIFLIGEPTPVAGSSKLRCLADVGGALCLIELAIKFGDDTGRG